MAGLFFEFSSILAIKAGKVKSKFGLFCFAQIASPSNSSNSQPFSKSKLPFIYFLRLIDPPKIFPTTTRITFFQFVLSKMRDQLHIIKKLVPPSFNERHCFVVLTIQTKIFRTFETTSDLFISVFVG